MKTFLIIIGCVFLYIFGTFITLVLSLYCDRCEFESYQVYGDIEEHLGFSAAWPLTIWCVLLYLLYLKLKKYAITLTEILYQINHKEDKEVKDGQDIIED